MKSQRSQRSSGSQTDGSRDKLLREFPQPVKSHPSLQQSPAPVEYSILVRNLPSCITRDQLQREFERVVSVRKIIIVSAQNTKKTHAYIHFYSLEEAKKAADGMNNVWLGNAQIQVELSTRTAKLMEGGVDKEQKSRTRVSCSEGHLDPVHMKDTSGWKLPSVDDQGTSAIPTCHGQEFDTSFHGDGIRSHSQQSSWNENENNGYTSVEVTPALVDTVSHNLPLLVSRNLSLKDNLQDGDCSVLDSHTNQQATHPARVLPVGSFGRGRGQLKQTFQHYLSIRGTQSSDIGHAALNKGHKQKVGQKEEIGGRQTVNLSKDALVSSDVRQEKTTPAQVPTLVPSFDPKSGSTCHGAESEIKLETKRKSQSESEMETGSHTAMPPSFLFQLLEASHIGGTFGTSENNIASLQKKMGDLEVELERLLRKNAAIRDELASENPVVDREISPEWERVYSRYLKQHANLVVKKEEHKSSIINRDKLLILAAQYYGEGNLKLTELNYQARLENLQEEIFLAKAENELLGTKIELNCS